jgi:hypothetical protein
MNPFRFAISLRVFSQVIDPDEIGKEIGLEAEWKHRIGDRRTTRKGAVLEGVYTIGYWTHLLTHRDEEELHEVLDRVCDDLVQHQRLFRRIRETGGRTEFFIGWYSIGNTGDTFHSDLLRKLSELQIDLALDVYGEDPPDQEVV